MAGDGVPAALPENARRLMEAVARDKAPGSSVATETKTIEELEEMAGGQE